MRLSLLVTTLCVVWSGIVTAAGPPDPICQHDGFFDPANPITSCTCKPGFDSRYCERRLCMNDGTLRVGGNTDYGCNCPPGFVGTTCQPTKCVGGDSKAFYADESDKMISVYITYNLDLQNKTESADDNPIHSICVAFINSNYYQLVVFYGQLSVTVLAKDKANCMTLFNAEIEKWCTDEDDEGNEYYVNCQGTNPSDINVDAISKVVDATTPNSQFFIITNYPLYNAVEADVQAVLKKAISKRLTIHSLVFTTPDVMDFNLYQNTTDQAGYQPLRTLAESTLGAYVTPYSGTAYTKFGTSNNQQAATQLLSMAKAGIHPAGIYSTAPVPAVPQVLFIGKNQDFYISSRVQGEDFNPFKTTFFNFSSFTPPPNFSYVIDTGYYRMVKGNAYDNDVISFIMNDRTFQQSNFVIFTGKTADVYPAITTSDIVDASSPYGDIASGTRTLVGKLANPTLTINPALASFYPSGKVSYNPDNSTRQGCQFPVNLGTIQCVKPGATFLQLQTDEIVGSVTPFYCAGQTATTNAMAYEFEGDFELDTADGNSKCTDKGNAASKLNSDQRSFAIISRNAREMNETTNRPTPASPVDRLYINKGNVFEYMLKRKTQTGQPLYQRYFYNLVDPTSMANTQVYDSQQCLDNVMNITADASDVTDFNDLDWFAALRDTASVLTGQNNGAKIVSSDIFLVIDNGTFSVDFGSKDGADLFKDLYTSRSRLFILALDTYGSYAPGSDPNIQNMATVAARTGGFMFRFSSYDDLQKFFDNYFLKKDDVYISMSDVVYQQQIPFSLTVQTDDISLPAKLDNKDVAYTLVIYGTNQILDSGVTFNCISSSAQTTQASLTTPATDNSQPTSTFGEASVYSLNSLKGDNVCNFFIMFKGPQSKAINVVIYAKNKDQSLFTTKSIVGFANSPDDSMDQPSLNFAIDKPQLPVATQPNTQLTIMDSSRNIILTEKMTTRDNSSCFGFDSLLSHNFQCTKANDFYYFQTTFSDSNNLNHTRTFVTQCISESGACLNGGSANGKGACVCPVGFHGDICETPYCQNGGTVTPANTCNCVPGFTGAFCQISNAICINSPNIPDSRSEVTSLIFVVEATDGFTFPQAVTQLPGVQVTVVQYNCDGITTTQLGTDATKLGKFSLTTGKCDSVSDVALNALLEGFNSQTTDRAVVVFAVTSAFNPINSTQDVFNKLASQRIDLRVFSTQTSTGSLDLLAQFGNGIVYQDDAANFTMYFTNYITNLFQTTINGGATGVPRLAVEQSGTGPLETLTLYMDEAIVTYIVHTFKGVVTVNDKLVTTRAVGSPGKSQIQFFTVTQSDAVVKITGDDTTKYSIEKMTTLPLAFGFQDTGINERLLLGLRTGVTNTLSLFTPRSYDSEDLTSLSQYPRVTVTRLDMDGNSSTPMILPTTHKEHSCKYSHYSIPIFCDNTTIGFSANIVTFTSSGKQRQEQKMLVCQKSDDLSCSMGTNVAGTCVCNDGWTGLECNQPICTSGSTRYGSVCMCPPGSTDYNCGTSDDQPTISPNAARAFVFILDSRGADANLYNMSVATIQDFMAMYNQDSLVLFVSSMSSASETSFINYDPKTIVSSINKLLPYRNNTNDFRDLTQTFETIYNYVQQAIVQPSLASAFLTLRKTTDINNIFYMGLTGVSMTSKNAMETLKSDYRFQVSSLLFTATDGSSALAQSQASSLITTLGNSFKISNNTNDAFIFMRDASQGSPITPVYPPVKSYSCVKKVQANIYIFSELSNVTNLPTYRQTFSDFLKDFRSDFERSPGYTMTKEEQAANRTGCTIDLNRFAEQSLISGFPFFFYSVTNLTSIGSVGYSFCSADTNYKNFEQRVASTSPNYIGRAEGPDWPSFAQFVSSYLTKPCQCSRVFDSATLKLVIWMPVTNGNAGDPTQFTDNNYVHLVLPFGFDVSENSFYYKLASSSLGKYTGSANQLTKAEDYIIPNADSYSAKDLVQAVWTKICQIQNIIPYDATAAPPQSQNISEDDMQIFYR